MAWTRTAVGLLANALVMLRMAWTNGSMSLLMASSALAMACFALLIYGIRRSNNLLGYGRNLPNTHALPFLAGCVLIACVVGAVAVLKHALSY